MNITTLIIIGTLGGIALATIVVLVVNQSKEKEQQNRLLKSLNKQLRQIESIQQSVPPKIVPKTIQALLFSLQKSLFKRMGEAQKSDRYKVSMAELDTQIEALKKQDNSISFEGLDDQKSLQNAKSGLTALSRLLASLGKTGQLRPEVAQKQLAHLKPVLDRVRIQSFLMAAQEAESEGGDKAKVAAHYFTQLQALTRGKEDNYSKKIYQQACEKLKTFAEESGEQTAPDSTEENSEWMQFNDSGELKKRNLYD